jgi:hypothetical protein
MASSGSRGCSEHCRAGAAWPGATGLEGERESVYEVAVMVGTGRAVVSSIPSVDEDEGILHLPFKFIATAIRIDDCKMLKSQFPTNHTIGVNFKKSCF